MHSKRSYEIALAQGLSPDRELHTLDDVLTVLRYTASFGESVHVPRWPFDVDKLLFEAARIAMRLDLKQQAAVRQQRDPSRLTYDAYWREVERGADYVRRHEDTRITDVESALDYLTGGRHPFLDHLARSVDVIEHTAHRRACGSETQYLATINLAAPEQIQSVIDCVAKNAMLHDVISEARAQVPHYRPNIEPESYWELGTGPPLRGPLRRRIQQLTNEFEEMMQKADAAYEKAARSRRARDHKKAEALDARVTAIGDELDELLVQLEEEAEHPEGDEGPGGDEPSFQPSIREQLAVWYANLLEALEARRRGQRPPHGGGWAYEPSEAEFIERVRAAFAHQMAPGTTDTQLMEAARDAYASARSHRWRLGAAQTVQRSARERHEEPSGQARRWLTQRRRRS